MKHAAIGSRQKEVSQLDIYNIITSLQSPKNAWNLPNGNRTVWQKCFHYINYNSKEKSYASLCPVSWLVCLFWELIGAVVEMPCYQKRQSRERAENLLYGSSVRALKCLCWRQMTWQHAACLTLCNLQDYPWFRANSERFRIEKRSKLRPFSLWLWLPMLFVLQQMNKYV